MRIFAKADIYFFHIIDDFVYCRRLQQQNTIVLYIQTNALICISASSLNVLMLLSYLDQVKINTYCMVVLYCVVLYCCIVLYCIVLYCIDKHAWSYQRCIKCLCHVLLSTVSSLTLSSRPVVVR